MNRKEIPTYEKDGQTLENFIKQNDILLTALGVFSALIVFARDIQQNHIVIAPLLSFVLVAGLVLIWLEIWVKLSGPMALRLFLFRYVLLWGGACVVMYWILESHYLWDILIPIFSIPVIFAVILNTISPIIRQFSITRRLFQIDRQKKTGWQWAFRAFCYFSIFIISTYTASAVSAGSLTLIEVMKIFKF